MDKLSALINNLSWNLPQQVQDAAINELVSIDEDKIALLVQPNGKDCWENAAIVLKNIGYPKISVVIPGLMEWLQDMTWPGAWTALEILEDIGGNKLLPYIEAALSNAAQEEDSLWIEAIRELVDRLRLSKSDFSSDKFNKILESI